MTGSTVTRHERSALATDVTEGLAPVAPRVRRLPAVRLRRPNVAALVFLLPLLVIFGVFSWLPILRSVVMSLQHTNLVDPPTFVGLDNFAHVLADPLFAKAVGNTVYFALLALIFGYPIPLILAVLMSEVRRSKGLFSALAYLPVVMPPVVAVLLWKVFFDGSSTGLFNSLLGLVGIKPQPWLQSAATVMPSLVLEATWAAFGGTILIYLAALVSVPPDLYDAADTDGASLWQKVRHITIPQLRGVLLVTFILQIIGTSQLFLEPFLFTGGGPANATTTILLLIYKYAFQNSIGGDYGAATALSLMLAGFLAVFSAGYFWLTRAWSEG
jgi:multiple sugar transport system permease protein